MGDVAAELERLAERAEEVAARVGDEVGRAGLADLGLAVETAGDVLEAVWRIMRELTGRLEFIRAGVVAEEPMRSARRDGLDRVLVDLSYGCEGVMVATHLIGVGRNGLKEVASGELGQGPGHASSEQ